MCARNSSHAPARGNAHDPSAETSPGTALPGWQAHDGPAASSRVRGENGPCDGLPYCIASGRHRRRPECGVRRTRTAVRSRVVRYAWASSTVRSMRKFDQSGNVHREPDPGGHRIPGTSPYNGVLGPVCCMCRPAAAWRAIKEGSMKPLLRLSPEPAVSTLMVAVRLTACSDSTVLPVWYQQTVLVNTRHTSGHSFHFPEVVPGSRAPGTR